jgi:hypothetical protein
MYKMVSLKIGFQCKAFIAVIARVRLAMGFGMAAYND